jgi:hypothetical protein
MSADREPGHSTRRPSHHGVRRITAEPERGEHAMTTEKPSLERMTVDELLSDQSKGLLYVTIEPIDGAADLVKRSHHGCRELAACAMFR